MRMLAEHDGFLEPWLERDASGLVSFSPRSLLAAAESDNLLALLFLPNSNEIILKL